MSLFFKFHQNNPGGDWDINPAKGIGPTVWIEAESEEHACSIAKDIGPPPQEPGLFSELYLALTGAPAPEYYQGSKLGNHVRYTPAFCEATSTTVAGLKDMLERRGVVVGVFPDGKLCYVDWGDYFSQSHVANLISSPSVS